HQRRVPSVPQLSFQVRADKRAVHGLLYHTLARERPHCVLDLAAGLVWAQRGVRTPREMLDVDQGPPGVAPGALQAGDVGLERRIVAVQLLIEAIEAVLYIHHEEHGVAGQRVSHDHRFRRMTTALQRDGALQVQARLAHDLYAIAGDLALHRSTASTQLLRAQRLLTQSPGPIRCECAVYRAGSRILSDADGWGKKSAYVIHVGFAGRGHDRSADPGVELGESGDVGRERSHLLSVIHHDQVVARPHDLRRLEAEGRQEVDRRRTRLGLPGGN